MGGRPVVASMRFRSTSRAVCRGTAARRIRKVQRKWLQSVTSRTPHFKQLVLMRLELLRAEMKRTPEPKTQQERLCLALRCELLADSLRELTGTKLSSRAA
jgi:hypothetical protein